MTSAEQDKPTPKRATSRIPRFKTIEEAAEWFDTHDTTEYEDEFEEVSEDIRFVVSRGRPKKPITVRMDELALARLTKQAQKLGVGPSTLARMWILEHLRETATKPPSSHRR
jgi:hypothetical protein